MTFVDTNVFMYAMGGQHPLKEQARDFFIAASRNQEPLCTSAEVLQEMLYCYLSTHRRDTLRAVISFIVKAKVEIWPLESADVYLACQLHEQYPALSERDLCHLASCQRRRIARIKTFDQGLEAALNSKV